ncbi:hypothetical protein QAD02_015344 [Eretmocerus hayati]|uniref:Uncharacterized protein n=1 Tax=Eretmocerus hayati TaxID=131215 RepID=A0ACC2PAS3_9HYME|nr:hypothetical protein QAD02_015344 [Eretmocerus hayati]
MSRKSVKFATTNLTEYRETSLSINSGNSSDEDSINEVYDMMVHDENKDVICLGNFPNSQSLDRKTQGEDSNGTWVKNRRLIRHVIPIKNNTNGYGTNGFTKINSQCSNGYDYDHKMKNLTFMESECQKMTENISYLKQQIKNRDAAIAFLIHEREIHLKKLEAYDQNQNQMTGFETKWNSIKDDSTEAMGKNPSVVNRQSTKISSSVACKDFEGIENKVRLATIDSGLYPDTTMVSTQSTKLTPDVSVKNRKYVDKLVTTNKEAQVKVNKEQEKVCTNQRLRETILPKNAIAILNEMKVGVQFTISKFQSIFPGHSFIAYAQIAGKTYTGLGASIQMARQNAAEAAFKSLSLEKMTMDAAKSSYDIKIEKNVSDEVPSTEVKTFDDLSWHSLASFALYKLFLQWQSQGDVVPILQSGAIVSKMEKELDIKPRLIKKTSYPTQNVSPLALLYQKRPDLIYSEVSRGANSVNSFTISFEINGQIFSGTARSKKDAKIQAAKNALRTLYNVVYPEEMKFENSTTSAVRRSCGVSQFPASASSATTCCSCAENSCLLSETPDRRPTRSVADLPRIVKQPPPATSIMYPTRSRQSQNIPGGTPQRAQNAGQQQFQGQGQVLHQQQGGNPAGNQTQQGGFKQQPNNVTPYKQQPQQQQQTPQAQRMPAQQQVKQEQTPQRMPQVKPQQQQQQQQLQQQQQQTPQAQRQLKPILKSTGNVQGGQTPAQAQNPNQFAQQNLQQHPNNGMETSEVPEVLDGDDQSIPKWKRKGPQFKVSRKVRRLRLNQRLRRTIQPKNAIMVLNEMKTGVQFTFPESQSALPSSLFVVHAKIDGKTYIGQGLSKHLARQNAAENAFKTLLLEKMTTHAAKSPVDGETDGSVLGDGENKDGAESMEIEEHEDIPWTSLASFALYKLFLEWQNQGTVVPVPRPGLTASKVKKEVVKPAVPKELPPNALSVHPVMLLNQMRPGLGYTEVSRVGNPPNITFTLACVVDGQSYTGTAKNKKDAKKQAAKNALHALYNLVYPEEKEGEDVAMA